MKKISVFFNLTQSNHCGTSSKEINGLDPARCKYRDDHWLGQGVYFFDYYKEQKGVAVVIGTFQKDFAGYTTRRNYSERELQKRIMDIIGIKFRERQICVSKKECIKTTKLIYNEEEVI